MDLIFYILFLHYNYKNVEYNFFGLNQNKKMNKIHFFHLFDYKFFYFVKINTLEGTINPPQYFLKQEMS